MKIKKIIGYIILCIIVIGSFFEKSRNIMVQGLQYIVSFQANRKTEQMQNRLTGAFETARENMLSGSTLNN